MTTAKLQAWDHRKDVVILVNPAKRKKIFSVLGGLAIFFVAVFVLSDSDGPLMKWAANQDKLADRLLLAPTMQRLAAQGKRDAIIWVAKSAPGTNIGQLEALAASGDGEALFIQAQNKWESDIQEAKRLIQLSADAGYMPAVKFVLNIRRHKITKWE